jgi:hypothetical protein
VGLGPAHLVLLAGLLTASGPGIHTCILSANQLGGLSKHAGQTSSIEETGKCLHHTSLCARIRLTLDPTHRISHFVQCPHDHQPKSKQDWIVK